MRNLNKIFISIVILLLPAALSSCGDTAEKKHLLDLEEYMERDPEGALAALDSINPDSYRKTETKALYSLLKSRALDKNFKDIDNDSIIKPAIDYFSQSSDIEHLMKAEYYLGIVNKNAGKYEEAIGNFLKAYDLSKEIGDPFWQGLSTRQISTIFNKTANSTEALIYGKISHERFKEANIENYIDYSLLDLCTEYDNIDMPDSCIQLLNPVLNKTMKSKDPYFQYETRLLLGLAYIEAKQYENAIRVLTPANNPEGTNSNSRAYLGIALVKNGDIKRGLAIIDSLHAASDSITLNESYFRYELYSALADTTNAFKALQQLYSQIDESFNKRKSSGLGAAILRIHTMQKDLDKAKIENQRYRIIILLFIIFIIICASFAGYWAYKRQIKKRLRKISNRTGSLTEMLESIDKENSRQKESIESLLYSQFKQVNEACLILYETGETEKTNKKIANKMMEMIDFLSNEKKAIDSLGKLVDRHCDNLFTLFRNDFPLLKEKDYMLFLLYALGFNNRAITQLLKVGVEAIYTRKNRLKNKISISDSINKEKYYRILNRSGSSQADSN